MAKYSKKSFSKCREAWKKIPSYGVQFHCAITAQTLCRKIAAILNENEMLLPMFVLHHVHAWEGFLLRLRSLQCLYSTSRGTLYWPKACSQSELLHSLWVWTTTRPTDAPFRYCNRRDSSPLSWRWRNKRSNITHVYEAFQEGTSEIWHPRQWSFWLHLRDFCR